MRLQRYSSEPDLAVVCLPVDIGFNLAVAYVLAGNMVAKTTHMIRSRSCPTIEIVNLFRPDVVRGSGSWKFLLQGALKNQVVSCAFGNITLHRVKKARGTSSFRNEKRF